MAHTLQTSWQQTLHTLLMHLYTLHIPVPHHQASHTHTCHTIRCCITHHTYTSYYTIKLTHTHTSYCTIHSSLHIPHHQISHTHTCHTIRRSVTHHTVLQLLHQKVLLALQPHQTHTHTSYCTIHFSLCKETSIYRYAGIHT